MAFRIGRKHAAHTYPSSQGNSTLLFARNFAQGPAAPQELTTTNPTEVGWGSIESGAPPGTGVPITPKVTGLLLIEGVLEMQNTVAESAINVQVQVGVGGVAVVGSPATEVTVDGPGFATVPIQVLIDEPVGATVEINLIVTASGASAITLNTDDSTLSIQEVPVATG